MDELESKRLLQRQEELRNKINDIRSRMNALDREHHDVWTEFSDITEKLEAPIAIQVEKAATLRDFDGDILTKVINFDYKSSGVQNAVRDKVMQGLVRMTGVWPESNQQAIELIPEAIATEHPLIPNKERLKQFCENAIYYLEHSKPINAGAEGPEYKEAPKLHSERYAVEGITDIHELTSPFWMLTIGTNPYKGIFTAVLIKVQDQWLAALQVTEFNTSHFESTDWSSLEDVITQAWPLVFDDKGE